MRFIPVFIFLSLLGLVRVEASGAADPKSPGSDSRSWERDQRDAFSQMDNAMTRQEESISPEDEYYLGRAVAANILEFYKPYQDDPALTRYLNTICAVLVRNSQKPVIFNGYHVMILNSSEFNGFATSGGHIFLTRGLVELADSEDALAAVIAHEIAHIQLRHGIKLIEDMRLTEDLSSAADRSGSIAGRGSSLEQRKNLFGNSVREMVNSMVTNGYSQAQEYEADALALSILAQAGYTPTSLIDVLKILQANQGNHPGGFGKTHPSPVLRISQTERLIRNYHTPDTRSFRQPRFLSIK